MALVAKVDRVLGRDEFDPPLGGHTLLIPAELATATSTDPGGAAEDLSGSVGQSGSVTG